MPGRPSLLVRFLLVAVALFAVVPSVASAAFTSSHVTAPAEGTAVISDADAAPSTFHVTGSVSPAAPGTTADVVCVAHPSGSTSWLAPLANDVPTDPTTGAFGVDVARGEVIGRACRVLAVNDSNNLPSNLTPFTGPRITGSGRESERVFSGSNAGKLFDFYIASTLLSAGNDFDSIGSCGHDDSYLYTSTPDLTEIFFCNSWLASKGPSDTPTLRVDGHPSFTAAAVARGDSSYFAGFMNLKPFPAFSYTYHLDPATHDLVVHETDHFVRCAPQADAFPPTSASCTSFVDAGVRLDRTIRADHAQQLVRILDRWSTTTGHAHPFAVQYENNQCFGLSGACSQHVGYRFPGHGGYSEHAVGDAVNGPFPGPASILLKDNANAGHGQAATTYSVAPNRATFTNATTHSDYTLTYANRMIPATGALVLQFADSTARTASGVLSLARFAEDQYSPPRVTIARPRDRALTAARKMRIRGTATDNVGVKSLTLNGKRLKLGAHGAFSRRVTLHAGRNVLRVVARDAAGSAGAARATVVELLARTGKPRTRKRGGRVVVDTGQALACPSGGSACKARLSAKAKLGKGHRASIGRAVARAAPGRRHELTFKLSKRGRRALKARKRLTVSLAVTVRRGGHVAARATRTLRLKR